MWYNTIRSINLFRRKPEDTMLFIQVLASVMLSIGLAHQSQSRGSTIAVVAILSFGFLLTFLILEKMLGKKVAS